MIEVIECGQEPEPIERRCRKCNSLLRFQWTDAKLVEDPRDGDFLEIHCPVCGSPVRTLALSGLPVKGY